MHADPTQTSSEPARPRTGKAMSRGWIVSLGLYYVSLAVVLFYLITEFWPVSIPLPDGVRHTVSLLWGALSVQFSITHEMQVISLVILSGGLGSFVHGASSFVNFVGQRSIGASWRWWYLLRPFVGMGLALGFYFVIRAGFFATSAGTGTFNTVGFTAAAFLVGMFSRQASEKLAEVFGTLFRVRAEDEDTLTPVVDRLQDEQPTGEEETGESP
jgi:hypothetical protein